MSLHSRYYYRGAATERRFIQLLRSRGFFAVRAPRSGKGYGVDIIAVKNGRAYLFEVKKRRDFTTIQIPREQYDYVKNVEETAKAPFLLTLYVASRRTWYVRPITQPDSIADVTVSYKPNEKWIEINKFFDNIT
ncbi:MAG: hypothetical protein QXE66_00190 [Desulfurococcaceae archaeon]